MSLLAKLLTKIEEKKEELIKIRHHLHANPEVSFKEFKTAKFIKDFYANKDVIFSRPLSSNNLGFTITIDSKKPGKTILIRADFDGLPIKETTTLSYKSKNGAMHACGHDVHTAYLMILADVLIEFKNELKGKIVIMHQHAEETPPGGAKEMIEAGLLENIDYALGIHVLGNYETGEVYFRFNEAQQARDKYEICIIGKGGHGSQPEKANDAIVAASYLVTALQTIISRRISSNDRAVLSVGSFAGEGTFNIIQEKVNLECDVRYAKDEIGELIAEEINKIAKGFALALSLKIKVKRQIDYPVLVNNNELTDLALKSLKEANLPEIKAVNELGDILSASEDFAYVANKVPSCFFYVGGGIKNHLS
ncbi:N-acyl-L-amino acid amidohydrolase [Mycoplasmopsis californica]|uniref:Amidohydrolase n=1 Tax=Mycoplasmopsis equigenitalium TaxID=114883 RepID=A0ABY5J1J5_9BACT|nr:amidohydrolase [Mycoplasmopsis equigenitalium]UUD37111.1 amidohydrolase [Mycoplasmopsis equigenitalium]VEU69585.1 N-acyl-L-amino acid amidohydrolase [Mycoplasmopsis californica]